MDVRSSLRSVHPWKVGQVKANVENIGGGSVSLFRPLDSEAQQWMAENVDPREKVFVGNALAVTYYFVKDLVDGFVEDGGSIMNEN